MNDAIRDHLRTLYDTHGRLTPDLVVRAARPKTHPLHSHFEWNNAKAGKDWRRVQAAQMIRTVKVTRNSETSQASRMPREWHCVRDESGHHYEPIDRILSDDFMGQLVLRDMERDWTQLKERYETFQEFWELVKRDAA